MTPARFTTVLFLAVTAALGSGSAARAQSGTHDAAGVVPPGTDGPVVSVFVPARVAEVDVRELTAGRVPAAGDEIRRAPGAAPLPDFSTGDPDPIAQTDIGVGMRAHRALSAPVVSFDGIAFTGIRPPDTNADVGPNHIVQMVNTHFAIWDKTGTLLAGTALINTIWTAAGVTTGPCATQNRGDPVVVYDQLADRWVLSQFASPSHLCFAVSRTPDPVAGGFFVYEFNVGSFPDYFKVGVWPSGYFVAANFGAQVAVIALNRGAMLAGDPANFVQFTTPGLPGLAGNILLPSDLDGSAPPPPGAPNIFYRQVDGTNFGGTDRLELFAFSIDFMNPAAATFTAVPPVITAPFDSALCGFFSFACVPQPGTSQRLDPINEWPMFPFRYRNFGTHETLVGNFVVDVTGADGHGIRWFELRRTGGHWFLQQEGTYAPQPGGAFVHRWIGAIAMDGSQNMSLGYSVAGAGVFPGIRYTGRLAADPPGQMPQGEETLINGGGSQTTSSRWGDYASMSIDPADDCTFWYTNEYQPTPGGGWRTRIGAWRFDSCGRDLVIDSITTLPAAPSPGETVNVTIRVRNAGGAAVAESFVVDFYQDRAVPPGPFQPGDFACSVSGLAAGATVDCVGHTVFAGAGTFNMWAQVDTDQQIAEADESNNVHGPQIVTVGSPPDLPMVTVTAGDPDAVEATLDPGTFRISRSGSTTGSLAVDYTVGGTATAGADYLTLAGSATIADGTSFVDVQVVPQHDAVRERNETVVLSIAAGAGYVVGSPSAATVKITEGPDLVVYSLAAPAAANPGQTIHVTVKTRNQGTLPTGQTTTRIWLSANNTLDPADTLLANVGVAALAAGATSSSVVPVTIPAATPSRHYLIARADALGVQVEANDANNQRRRVITIGPDYVVSTLFATPATVAAGSSLTVSDTTKNIGANAADTTTTRFVLSRNKSVEAADLVLGSRAVRALGAGESDTAASTFTLPAGTASGTWYVIAIADLLNQLAEVNEANNRRVFAITVP